MLEEKHYYLIGTIMIVFLLGYFFLFQPPSSKISSIQVCYKDQAGKSLGCSNINRLNPKLSFLKLSSYSEIDASKYIDEIRIKVYVKVEQDFKFAVADDGTMFISIPPEFEGKEIVFTSKTIVSNGINLDNSVPIGSVKLVPNRDYQQLLQANFTGDRLEKSAYSNPASKIDMTLNIPVTIGGSLGAVVANVQLKDVKKVDGKLIGGIFETRDSQSPPAGNTPILP